MGVRGFTTYMAHHSNRFLEPFQLKNCYLILDGNGIAINLYQWHTRANDCFGGDYDNYANIVNNFFSLLKTCNVTPIVVFDGGYENRKLKTVFSRMRNRIGAIKRLNSMTEGSVSVFPMFVKELFQDIALELGVKCIRNDYESDSEIACMARNLDCPILGYDSDFYFFDTLYIPFTKFDMKLANSFNKELKKMECFIPCEVYRVDKFLKYFGGLDKNNLPLLPVLLGNDYVKKSLFSAFYRHIKLKKCKAENEQQRLIKTVIYWLRHETLESAIAKILGRFKAKRRTLVTCKLNQAMQGYLQVNSTLSEYLEDLDQSAICMKEEHNIDIFKIEPIIEEEQLESDEGAVSDEQSENEDEVNEFINDNDKSSIENAEPKKIYNSSGENFCFSDKYRRCLLSQCFVDIKMRSTYFCISQVEDYSEPNSHSICLDLLSQMHKILTRPRNKYFVCVARGCESTLKKQNLPICVKDVPSFDEIQNFDGNECKNVFFQILNINKNYQEFLDLFPSDWHLFLISLYYWKTNSKKVVDTSFIYSLILCSILLNLVDPLVGFCRSLKTLHKKFKRNMKDFEKMNENPQSETVLSFENIDYDESLLCLKTVLNYFHMDPKMSSNSKVFDATVVDKFSEFQSCLLHIKYLNSLLNFPFKNVLVSKFFCGTLLYNLTVNFRKRTNLKSYVSILLKDCSSILYSFQMIIECIDKYFGQIGDSDAKKRRKRKRKAKTFEDDRIHEEVLDEETFIDEENKYSILQSMNFMEI